MPELLQRDATPQNLADALVPLIGDTPERRRQCEGLARLDAVMEVGVAVPSARAAAIVLAMAGHIPPGFIVACGVLTEIRKGPPQRHGQEARDKAPEPGPRRDYGGARFAAGLCADQCGTRRNGGHHRLLDRRAHRHQGAPHPQGAGARDLAHGERCREGAPRQDRHRARRNRSLDLRDHDSGHGVSVHREPHLRHGRHPQYRQFRRPGGLFGFPLRAHHRDAIHRDGPSAESRRRRRRQDVGDHRLHRPCDLRAVRRRCRRGDDRAVRATGTASSIR